MLGTWACQTRVPYYKELKIGKLEYHRRKKKKKVRVCVFTKNSSLVNLSIVLHGTWVYQARVPCGIFLIHVSTSFFMILECLKLDLHSGILLLILQIVVCCY